jgi:putative ABC transport system permease protein
MRTRAGSVLLRGMRWRLTGSILIVLTAAIAMGTAIVGPLYLQAGGDSLVRRALATAPEDRTGFTVVPELGRRVDRTQLMQERNALIRRSGLPRVFGAPLTSVLGSIGVTGPDSAPYASQLAARTGICSVLHFRAGSCDLGPGDAVISIRSARALKVSAGATITVTTTTGTRPLTLTITGVFGVPKLTSGYWFDAGSAYFPFGRSSGKPQLLTEVDDVFVSAATALAVPAGYGPAISIQTPVRPGAIGSQNARQTMRAMQAIERDAAGSGLQVSTDLASVLASALHQRRLMDTIVAVVTVQLVLLAIWVLVAVLMRSSDLRRSELRVARLRGFPLSSMLAVAMAEPAILCAIGAVLGVAGAWAGVSIVSTTMFSPGTTVAPDAWVFVGFGAVGLTICSVLGFSAMGLLRGSGLERPTPSTTASSGSRVVVDVAILVLSVVALLAAATSGALASHDDPLAAAAPAVVALGASVIAIRLVEFLCRRASSMTVDSRWVASFLAVRQIGRRPAALRESRTLVIALALACFAVCAWSISRTNRASAATFSVGAPIVATVTPERAGLQQAVDRVDPHGRFAMPAIEISTAGQDLLGVDAPRLGQVIAWPGGISRESVAEVSRALVPRTAPQVNLGAGSVSVRASVGGAGAAGRSLGDLNLSLWTYNATEGTSLVHLGTLASGPGTYRGSLSAACPGGCRLVGIGVLPNGDRLPAAGRIDVTLSALAVRSAAGSSSRIRTDLSAADWRSTAAGVSVEASRAGVSFAISAAAVARDLGAAGDSTPAMASVADDPLVIPEAAGSVVEYTAIESGEAGTLSRQGLDGNPVTVRPVISATALPRVGNAGEMADLTLLERARTDATSPTVTDEVWLGPKAPADAVDRLRAAGLSIDSVQRAAAIISQGRHTGPAQGYDFMLLATILALLAAAVSTFGVSAAGTRQRAAELSALEVTGVPRSVLTRSLAFEAAILALTALFGAAAGAVGAALAIPALPQLGATTDVPLSYGLPMLLILGTALCGVLVVLAATAVAARGILGEMSPSLLRAAEYDAD